MINVRLSFCLLACAMALFAGAQDRWHVQQYTSNNGLPQNSVRSLAFDEDGYLWMTTEGGLVRFDGKRFQVHIPSTDTVMREDRMGHLFRTWNGDLLATDAIGSLYQLNDGVVCRLYDGKSLSKPSLHISASLPSTELFGMFVTRSFDETGSSIWNAPDQEIVALSSERWVVAGSQTLEIRKADRIERRTLLPVPRSQVFMLDSVPHVFDRSARLLRLDIAAGTLSRVELDVDMRGEFRVYWTSASAHVHVALRDTLYRLERSGSDRAVLLPMITDLPKGTAILAVSADGQGDDIFIGTGTKGLFHYHRTPFRTAKRAHEEGGVSGNAFYATVPWGSASVLVQDGWVCDTNGTFSRPKREWHHSAFSGHLDILGRYWNSRLDTLVVQDAAGQSVSTMQCSAGWPGAFLEEGDTVWVAGTIGVTGYVGYSEISNFPTPALGYRQQTFDIARAPNGHLWVARGGGVIDINTSTGSIDTVPGTSGLLVRALHRKGERVYLGTYGQGAWVMHAGDLRKLRFQHADLVHVHAFVPDNKGWLWMPTNRGLFRCRVDAIDRYMADTTAVIPVAFHGTMDGIDVQEFNGGCSPNHTYTATGHLVLPTMDGLVWFKPDEVPDPWPNASVRLDGITINGETLIMDGLPLTVGSGARIQVAVGQVHWGEPRNQQLRFSWSGFSTDFEPVPPDGVIHADRLPPGSYALTLRKPTNAGHEDRVLLSIMVLQPWYLRWWFILLGVLCLVGLGFSLQRMRVRSLLQRGAELERIVGERTAQLHERNEVLRQEGQVKERLMRILSHDIVAPLKALARVGRGASNSEQDRTELREALAEMSSTSDQLFDNANNLLSWIKHQGGSVTVRKQLVALHALTVNVVAPLRHTAEDQNVSITNAVPEDRLVTSDPDLLAIILQNVVGNALKHAPGAEVWIGTVESQDHMDLVVRDTGPGMNSATLARLQGILQGNARDPELSAGLGFMIIADMAQVLGVTVTLRSIAGKGTEVCIGL